MQSEFATFRNVVMDFYYFIFRWIREGASQPYQTNLILLFQSAADDKRLICYNKAIVGLETETLWHDYGFFLNGLGVWNILNFTSMQSINRNRHITENTRRNGQLPKSQLAININHGASWSFYIWVDILKVGHLYGH